MDEKELFKEIGMNVNEGKVYSELVKHGKLSASEISSRAGVPYGKIYVVLQSLIDKGFVRVVPEKTKKFVSSSPENLEKAIDERKKMLDEAKEKVKELKQFYDEKEGDFLAIAKGDKGFWKIAEDMKKVEKYAYNIKWKPRVNSDTIQKRKTWNKKNNNIDVKELVRYDDETKKDVDKLIKVIPSMKKFENEGIALSILDDEEVMIGLIKKNTTLLIRDSAFAKVMKQLFLPAYEKAENIK